MGFLDVLLRCPHKKLSFPITLSKTRGRPLAGSLTVTYRVCLDCGHELPYDWNEMKVVREASASLSNPAIETLARNAR
jgi:hypothetical protein